MSERVVRTVRGDVRPAALGRVDFHEHLLMRSPLLRDDALDDVEASAAEAAALRRSGFETLVELTPIGVGRDPRGLAAIAEGTELHVVMATGLHQEAHYPPEHWAHRTDEEVLAELFTRDLLEGCDGADYSGPLPDPTTVRAGVIKVGIGYWSIGTLERRVLRAAGQAHVRTGAAVVCHLERGSAGLEALAALEAAGVPPHRLALAHVDRNPDPAQHLELTKAGAYLCYDGPGRVKDWPDHVILDCLLRVAEGGGAQRLLLGADVARRSRFHSYGGQPGLAYLGERFVPRLLEQGGRELCELVLQENPARLLALDPLLVG